MVWLLTLLLAAGIAFGQEPAPAGLRKDELNIWNDPAFQKRFAESYLAETEIEPRVTADERAQMQKVLELIAADKLDDAVKALEKERDRNAAASAVFDFTVANIYFQQEKFDQAAAAYRAAVEKYPKFRRAWKNKGLIHIRQGEFADAADALTRVVELGGNDAVTMGLLGYAYSMLDNHLSAESAYRMAILMDPATLDWKMGLARSFFKQARYAEAAALTGLLLQQHPARADLWLLQANAYIGMGQPLKAAEVYELVEQLGQSTPESLMMLGDIYINEELYAPAVRAYQQALNKDAAKTFERALRSAKALVARGAAAETRQMLDAVDRAYGAQMNPQQRKELLKLRARLAVADGSGGDEEARILEEIITLDPLDGEALILLGQHMSRKGDTDRAVFYYERAAAIEAFEADAKVRHAQLLVGAGKYEEALPLLRRAQQIKPRDNIQEYLEQVERVAKAR